MVSHQEKTSTQTTPKTSKKSFIPPQNPSQNKTKSTPAMEKEIRQFLHQISPEKRHHLAEQLLKQLKNQAVEKKKPQLIVSLSTQNPQQMSIEEIAQLATYIYHHDPDTFRNVLTQPDFVQFLSNPILSAIVGIMAAKWLNQ